MAASVMRKVKLKEVCDRITVGHVGPMADKYVADGIPFLRSQNIAPFRLNTDDIKFVPREFHEKLRKSALRPGDVAVVRTGYPGTACVIPDTFDELNCADLVVITPSSELNPHYLAAIFNSAWGMASVAGNLVGVAQQHFNIGAAKELEVGLPPRPAQDRIAGILSAYDELIENSQRRIKILESMARALYREWFVHFRFPGHESVPRVPSPLGEIPKGWSCVRLADVSELTVGGDWGKDAPEGDEWVEVGCLRGVDLHAFTRSGYSDVPVRWIKRSSLEKRRVSAVDVLVEGSGECGRSLAGGGHLERLIGRPVVYSNFCKRVRCRDASMARYVEYMLNSMVGSGEMTQYRTGTTIPNLNMSALFEAHRFVLPPEELLRHFVGLLLSSDAFKFSGSIQNLRRTRDLLLPRLLSGQIDVEAISA